MLFGIINFAAVYEFNLIVLDSRQLEFDSYIPVVKCMMSK